MFVDVYKVTKMSIMHLFIVRSICKYVNKDAAVIIFVALIYSQWYREVSGFQHLMSTLVPIQMQDPRLGQL